MTDDICGYTDTTTGHPCQRPAGWGRDQPSGYCKEHATDEPMAGRNTVLNKQMQESIASDLEAGHSLTSTCRTHGIGVSTFYDWLDRGANQDQGVFSEFSDRVARARGVGEQHLVDELLEMAREQRDTRTILSVIKSRYPNSWGDADAAESGGGGVNVYLSAENE